MSLSTVKCQQLKKDKHQTENKSPMMAWDCETTDSWAIGGPVKGWREHLWPQDLGQNVVNKDMQHCLSRISSTCSMKARLTVMVMQHSKWECTGPHLEDVDTSKVWDQTCAFGVNPPGLETRCQEFGSMLQLSVLKAEQVHRCCKWGISSSTRVPRCVKNVWVSKDKPILQTKAQWHDVTQTPAKMTQKNRDCSVLAQLQQSTVSMLKEVVWQRWETKLRKSWLCCEPNWSLENDNEGTSTHVGCLFSKHWMQKWLCFSKKILIVATLLQLTVPVCLPCILHCKVFINGWIDAKSLVGLSCSFVLGRRNGWLCDTVENSWKCPNLKWFNSLQLSAIHCCFTTS